MKIFSTPISRSVLDADSKYRISFYSNGGVFHPNLLNISEKATYTVPRRVSLKSLIVASVFSLFNIHFCSFRKAVSNFIEANLAGDHIGVRDTLFQCIISVLQAFRDSIVHMKSYRPMCFLGCLYAILQHLKSSIQPYENKLGG